MTVNAALVFAALEVKASLFIEHATEIFVSVSVLVRPDSRDCNLMLFSGLPANNWKEYFYTSIEEINSPSKAIVRWINN